jgi:hypothetical protein
LTTQPIRMDRTNELPYRYGCQWIALRQRELRAAHPVRDMLPSTPPGGGIMTDADQTTGMPRIAARRAAKPHGSLRVSARRPSPHRHRGRQHLHHSRHPGGTTN